MGTLSRFSSGPDCSGSRGRRGIAKHNVASQKQKGGKTRLFVFAAWDAACEKGSALLFFGLLRSLLFLLGGLLLALGGLLLRLLLRLRLVGRGRSGALGERGSGGAGEKRGHQDCDDSLHGASFSVQ